MELQPQVANKSGGGDKISALVIRIVDAGEFKLNAHRIRMEVDGSIDDASQDTMPLNETALNFLNRISLNH